MIWTRRQFPWTLMAAATAGCGVRTNGTTLRLVNVQGILAPVLADSLGHFREQGLDVEISDVTGVSKAVQSMAGGSADVAVAGLDQAIQLNIDGVAVKAFFLIGRRPGAALVVSPKAAGRIRKITDLKGSVVGVTAPGSTAQWYLYHLMTRDGMAPGDVSIAGIGTMATAVAALELGKVDAAIVLPYPLASLRRRHPDLVVLAEMITAGGMRNAYGLDTLPNLCLIAKSSWLERRPNLARKVARAMASTHAWIQLHIPEQIRDKLPTSARLEDAPAELDYIASIKETYSEDGRMPPNGPADLMRVLAGSVEKLRESTFDLQRAYTNEFLAG